MKPNANKSNNNDQFVVTTFSLDKSKILGSEIWDSSHPMTIGHPIRWVLEKTSTGIRVRQLGLNLNKMEKAVIEEFPFEKLNKGGFIPLTKLNLRLHPVSTIKELRNHSSANWTPRVIETPLIQEEQSESNFKKACQVSLVGIGLLCLLCMLWPEHQPNPEEIIPPQYAKVLMTPAFHSKASSTQSTSKPAASSGRVNIVQAFESKTVKKSAQKLINGGALALLARSSLLSGLASKNQVNQIFDSHSKFSESTAKLTDDAQVKTVQLGTIGGGAKKTGSANNVGYSDGERAAVKGQGTAFVSLDTSELQVQDGLTADEVGKIIHKHLAEIRYCYESSMLRDPHIEGKMLVDFLIQGTGRVKTASVKNTTISDLNLQECVLSHLKKWQFPKPKGGIDVAVSYPFIFKTLDN